jgi:predicted dehydrogenase
LSNDSVNFSLIGVGKIGIVHAWSARNVVHSFDDIDPNEVNMVGVYNRTVSKANWAKKRFGFKYSTGNWRDILKDGETNSVSITLPNNLHYELVKEFAEAGINIMCEKPLGVNLNEALKMYEIVHDSKIVDSVALVLRFLPSALYAKEIIEKGKLGEIYHYRAVVAHSRYVDPNLKMEWRMKKELAGGGALADIGIHLIDLARFLIGDISDVVAETKTFIKKRKNDKGEFEEVDVDDAAILIMNFENGVLGSIESTRFGPGFQELDRIEIHGSNGMIRFYLDNPFEIFVFLNDEDPKGVKRIVLKPWPKAIWPPSKSIEGWGFLFVTLFHNFFKSILSGSVASPNFYDGLKAQEIVEAAYISSKERRWVKLPLVDV